MITSDGDTLVFRVEGVGTFERRSKVPQHVRIIWQAINTRQRQYERKGGDGELHRDLYDKSRKRELGKGDSSKSAADVH